MLERILLIEPYYGGSHKQFLDGLVTHVSARFTLLSLPARKWKMRMQLSAPWFVGKIREMEREKRFFDTVLCSTFIDVAVFKALVENLDGWNGACRFLTYFHENQFEYPDTLPRETIHQFTAINFTTALVSDSLAFNSDYNLSSFLKHCRMYTEKAADMALSNEIDKIREKSIVLYPGMEFDDIDSAGTNEERGGAPLIIWNHRWEHDKNPDEFFGALFSLKEKGVPFRLAVLGQQFRNQPDCFEIARVKLHNHIVHYGYIEDRCDYCTLLAQANVVVSTALHEFFGLAVLEAVRGGCVPVLPNRLSYPELFDGRYLYEDGQLHSHLEQVLSKRPRLSIDQRIEITRQFSWQSQAKEYKNWFKRTRQ